MSITSKVPMGQKIAFGFGMLANQMFPAVISIFIVVLVQNLGFPGWMWGVVSLVPRLFDAITDPIMGFISDNTKSKWGRRKQYVLLGAVIMGISFIIMWQLYKDNTVDYNFTYFLLWSLVFYVGLTIFSVPYVAMGYEMSNDFHERTNIMAVAQFIGQWAWVIAPWFWVIMDDKSFFESGEVAVRELAIWVGIICMIFAMIPAIFIKSKSTLNEKYDSITFKNILKSLHTIFIINFGQALKIKAFRKLCVATFLIFNAFNTVAAFTYFIIVFFLFNGATGPDGAWWWPTLFGSVGALVTTFLVIPVVTQMSKKIGKKKAFIVSQSVSIIGYIMLWFLFIPGKPYLFLFALPFFSFGIGGLFTLMMSMTADVIDLDELNTGKRREGIFGAIYWWMVKFGFGIAGGLSGVIFSVIGWESGGATQSEEALFGLRLFFSGLPILGTLIAIYVMWDYDLSEEKAGEIRAKLERRKASNSEALYQSSILKNSDSSGISLSSNKLEDSSSSSKNAGSFTVTISPEKIEELKNKAQESKEQPYVKPSMFRNSFSFEGRIRRLEYGLSFIIYYIWMFFSSLIAISMNAEGLYYLCIIPGHYFLLAQGAKRCHDRGNSGWYQIIPFYGLWMLFGDGDIGANEYGSNPKGIHKIN